VKRGYKTEWKIRNFFEKRGWLVVRSAGSIGISDLVCFKNGKCIFLQIKKSRNKKVYIYDKKYLVKNVAGFPYYIVVDFGYGKIKVFEPSRILEENNGEYLESFCERLESF